MRSSISRWGNSLAVRLPRHAVEGANLQEGSAVEVEVKEGTVVVRPVRKRFKLAELLAQMEPKHEHKETDWGPAQGEEAW